MMKLRILQSNQRFHFLVNVLFDKALLLLLDEILLKYCWFVCLETASRARIEAFLVGSAFIQ